MRLSATPSLTNNPRSRIFVSRRTTWSRRSFTCHIIQEIAQCAFPFPSLLEKADKRRKQKNNKKQRNSKQNCETSRTSPQNNTVRRSATTLRLRVCIGVCAACCTRLLASSPTYISPLSSLFHAHTQACCRYYTRILVCVGVLVIFVFEPRQPLRGVLDPIFGSNIPSISQRTPSTPAPSPSSTHQSPVDVNVNVPSCLNHDCMPVRFLLSFSTHDPLSLAKSSHIDARSFPPFFLHHTHSEAVMFYH